MAHSDVVLERLISDHCAHDPLSELCDLEMTTCII